ncbi:trigger factor [Kiloniella laminariae]|uniref:Trigger factor n=1 Tax=Kiloniella laminariae TaxID=454162 RepID=A0ABT4LLK3_9PROT|nr:trigger factor [Kiloniella laminariae]MCZ4281993.1 trigger factor [Kiloniella laminariae]
MQVTETNADNLKREFTVVVPATDIDAKIDSRLVELSSQVKLPGFRPGKVPMTMLKQRYGKSVMGEVLEALVNETSQNIISERSLRPAMQPKIEVTSFDEGKDLEYTIAFEIIPDVEPMDFSTLKLEKISVEVPASEVDEALERIAANHKTTVALKRKRKAREGDIVTIDFKGTVGGEALPGMAGDDFKLELGSGQFIPGFEDQVVGANVDDDVTVNVTFPEGYGNEKLSGKDAIFEVKVKDIEETAAAEIDDALAEKLGEENLEKLKARVAEQIKGEYDRVAHSRLKRDLLDKLAESHDFGVPESMVESEFEGIWRQIESDKDQGKLDEEDAAKSDDELKAEYQAIAVRRVRLGLLLSEVGTKNQIEVTQDELNSALLQEARNYPGQEQAVFEFYQKNPQAIANLRAPVFEDKVVNYIVDLAKVTEKSMSPDELRKAFEAEGVSTSEEKPAKKAAAKKAPAKKPAAKKAKADAEA